MNWKCAFLQALFFVLALAGHVLASGTITYQGTLEESGAPFSGTVQMTFALAEEADGAPFETLDDLTVQVIHGVFSVELAFSDQAFSASPRWLEISIDRVPLGERRKITAVPFALSAPGGEGGSKWTLSGTDISFDGGNVGIGISDPQRPLHVSGSAILGLANNSASSGQAFVSGGSAFTPNTAAGQSSFVGGGFGNEVESSALAGFIGGGRDNLVSGNLAYVGGGRDNEASGSQSFVAGGAGNNASGTWSFVSGGAVVPDTIPQEMEGNSATGDSSFVAGGVNNLASGHASFASGGGLGESGNEASGEASFVAGGTGNRAGGARSFVAGESNAADGRNAVAIGAGNEAEGFESVALGTLAKAADHQTFVWSGSQEPFASTGPGQFLVEAPGGVGINTNEPNASLGIFASSEKPALRVIRSAPFVGQIETLSISATGSVAAAELVSNNIRMSNFLPGPGDSVCRRDSDGRLVLCGSSSRKHKDKVEDFGAGEATALLELLRPVRYQWTENGRDDIGLIAEEVAEVIPEITIYGDSGNIEGFRHSRLGPLLVAGFQERKAANAERFASLEQDHQRLAMKNAELRAEVAVLKVQSGQVRELERRLADMEERERENDDLRARLAALEAVLLEHGQIAKIEQ